MRCAEYDRGPHQLIQANKGANMSRQVLHRCAAAGLLAAGISTGAAAQDTGLRPGWSFEIAPYVWLPSVDANLRYSLPSNIGGTADVKANADDYFANLNFAAAFAATARYRSLLTDVMYVSADAGSSRVESANVIGVGRNQSAPRTSTSTRRSRPALDLGRRLHRPPGPGAMSMLASLPRDRGLDRPPTWR